MANFDGLAFAGFQAPQKSRPKFPAFLSNFTFLNPKCCHADFLLTGVLRQIAPDSSPERSAKSLSHSFFVVPCLSLKLGEQPFFLPAAYLGVQGTFLEVSVFGNTSATVFGLPSEDGTATLANVLVRGRPTAPTRENQGFQLSSPQRRNETRQPPQNPKKIYVDVSPTESYERESNQEAIEKVSSSKWGLDDFGRSGASSRMLLS